MRSRVSVSNFQVSAFMAMSRFRSLSQVSVSEVTVSTTSLGSVYFAINGKSSAETTVFCNSNCIHLCPHITLSSSSNANIVEWLVSMPAVRLFVGSVLTIGVAKGGQRGHAHPPIFRKYSHFEL